jgi:hypothetical protein
MPPICFPAALCSTGVTPLPSSYGGSDSCRALLAERACPGRSPVFTRVIPHRHTVTNHRDGCPSPFRPRREAPTPCGTGNFALRSQARHRHHGRIVFTCHYGLSVGFRCFPPRLTATQLLLFLTGSRQPMDRVFHPAGSRRLTAHDRASPLAHCPTLAERLRPPARFYFRSDPALSCSPKSWQRRITFYFSLFSRHSAAGGTRHESRPNF